MKGWRDGEKERKREGRYNIKNLERGCALQCAINELFGEQIYSYKSKLSSIFVVR